MSGGSSGDAEAGVALAEEPTLRFRQLHQDVLAFASGAMDADDEAAQQVMTALVGVAPVVRATKLFAPPSASERAALQNNSVKVAGKRIDVSSLIQQEITKLSDEFRASEELCFSAWLIASDERQREWLEQTDQLAAGAVTGSIPAAARHVLVSEVEFRLHLIKELLCQRFAGQHRRRRGDNAGAGDSAATGYRKRRQFLLAYTNQLLRDGLVSSLVTLLDEQLPALLQIPRLKQSAAYWHGLVADCLALAASSSQLLPREVAQLARALQSLCTRLNTIVAHVSPHIVNLSSLAQLFEEQAGGNGSSSPQGAVKQVSCMLRAISTLQVTLFAVLLQDTAKIDRESDELVDGAVLNGEGGSEHASVVRELHQILYRDAWENQQAFQSVAMLAWAGFLAGSSSDAAARSTSIGASPPPFAECEDADLVVKKAVEGRAFTTVVDVLLKYMPDRQQDALVYGVFERNLELLMLTFASKILVDVPTLADKAALAAMQTQIGRSGEGNDEGGDETVAAWHGDCLENVMDVAVALCAQDPRFCRTFWHYASGDSGLYPGASASGTSSRFQNGGDDDDNDDDQSQQQDREQLSCHAFLLACRDAAFKNPSCLAAYLRLVAAAARGSRECAQHAFHHVKQNPAQLSWDQFFLVMAKYQRLLLEAERPLLGFPGASLNGGAGSFGINAAGNANAAANGNGNGSNAAPGPRFIRPKELEALESIQAVIQAVVLRDQQLALLFFHNHDWSPIATFVTFLQSRIPSSLKGALMKTLAAFARVPEIAPFVWREVDALQILRTTGETSGYGNQDLAYELEHYESLSRAYPATRGLVALLNELFAHPIAWNALEGDGRVAAIQVYFEFLLDHVFLKFDLRKYEREEEKWALANGTLAIFKQILGRAAAAGSGNSMTPEGGLAYQLLARFLSSSPLLDKLLAILSGDDGSGVENLENSATDLQLEHSFFYCLDIVKRATEAKHGSLKFVIDISKRSSDTYLTKTSAIAALRERCVQHALEILVLVLEADAQFVNVAGHVGGHGSSTGLQVERLHAILSRHRADFVQIATYVKYSKASRIPHLSAAILRLISNRMAGRELVDLLVDSGTSADVTGGYVDQLLRAPHVEVDDVMDGEEDAYGREEPLTQSSEASELSIAAARARAARSRKVRQEIGDLSGAVRLEDEDDSAEHQSADSTASLSLSIRGAILDLLLENLAKPAPNLSHLLLGVLDDADVSSGVAATAGASGTVLDAVLSLVCSPEFGIASPDLACRCYKLLHLLLTQDYSTTRALTALESDRFEFFATQIELFASVFRVSRRRAAVDQVAELDMRGWFFKSLAVYLHVGLQKDPPAMKKVNLLMGKLLSTLPGGSTRQAQMLLLRLLDETSFDLSPPKVPTNEHVVALAEKTATTVEHDFYKWLRIDVEQFIQALQALDFTSAEMFARISKKMRSNRDGNSSAPMTDVEQFIQWAVEWNVYSERIAAESHALNSLRELMEVIVLDYLALPTTKAGTATPTMLPGLDAVGSAEVRLELASGIVSSVLTKVTTSSTARGGPSATRVSAQLFEIVAQIALLLVVAQRPTSGSISNALTRQSAVALVELLVRAIVGSANATGNPAAARNARTLLYTCVVHLLDRLPIETSTAASSWAGVRSRSASSITSMLVTPQLIDLIARDASDGDDPLNMALAVAALETILAVETADSLDSAAAATRVSSLVAVFRERGYLLHFIGVFRKLIEMDAVAFERVGANGLEFMAVPSSAALPTGVDAATLGTIYECLLSFFTRVAGTRDGALALVEGGLVRTLTDARNLPTHRPKHLHDSTAAATTSASIASAAAFQRIVSVYYRKWLPVVRFVSACCAALPQHRALASQVLELVSRHRKLFTSSLKVVAASNARYADSSKHSNRRRSLSNGSAHYQDTPMDMSLLREVSYVTFILRYVTPFDDLCSKALVPAKWEKLAQLVLHVLLFFGQELAPKGDYSTGDIDSTSGSIWWKRTVPRTPTEQREAAIDRGVTCDECHDALLDKLRQNDSSAADAAASTANALLHLTLFEEEKLYTSRMIVCNAAAYCASRMMTMARSSNGSSSSNNPLLAATQKPRSGRGQNFPSMASGGMVNPRAFAAATDPLWAHAPSMSEFTALFDVVVDALQSGKSLQDALTEMTTTSSNSLLSSSQTRHRCDLSHAQHVAEYHVDSLTFVAENMLTVLLLHFCHYLAPALPADRDADASALQPTLIKVLTIVGDMENGNQFVHALARKLRELTIKT